jgi:hypothetical protein
MNTPSVPNGEGGRLKSRICVAPIGRDGSAIAEVLRRAGREVIVSANLAELVAAIENGARAVLVTEEGFFDRPNGSGLWRESCNRRGARGEQLSQARRTYELCPRTDRRFQDAAPCYVRLGAAKTPSGKIQKHLFHSLFG